MAIAKIIRGIFCTESPPKGWLPTPTGSECRSIPDKAKGLVRDRSGRNGVTIPEQGALFDMGRMPAGGDLNIKFDMAQHVLIKIEIAQSVFRMSRRRRERNRLIHVFVDPLRTLHYQIAVLSNQLNSNAHNTMSWFNLTQGSSPRWHWIGDPVEGKSSE